SRFVVIVVHWPIQHWCTTIIVVHCPNFRTLVHYEIFVRHQPRQIGHQSKPSELHLHRSEPSELHLHQTSDQSSIFIKASPTELHPHSASQHGPIRHPF
ncbi:hypothetical protein KIN20_028042, partial [Parelaphostrongylus tenuis]